MTIQKHLRHIALFTFSALLFACSRQDKSEEISAEIPESAFPMMKPSKVKYPKLNPDFVQSKSYLVDDFCSRHFRNESSNLSLLVAKNGQIIYEKYQGVANREAGIDLDADTPLHIASVSKVITATAILLLVDRKKIDLDQKVNTILDDFPYPEITVRTLLNHRSGLRNYAYFTEDKGVWDRKVTLTNQDILNLFSEKNIQLEYPTDRHFAYCNTNYAMLALIIEKSTGMTYPAAMKEMIFKPLGMHNTFVYEHEKDKETAMPSYKGNNIKLALDYLDAIYGDKNIYSTPRDLLKFDMARKAPTFLKPKLRNQIYVGYSNERKGTRNYGLGMRMIEWETGQKFYFHNGWWHGNTSSYISLVKENVTIIALSNKFTRNTYAVRKLAPAFGDYPFQFDEED